MEKCMFFFSIFFVGYYKFPILGHPYPMSLQRYVNDEDLDDVVSNLPQCIVSKKVIKLLLKQQLKQRTPEWYATRRCVLTASDCATALGINPYQTRANLIKKKLGYFDNVQPDPQMVKATEHGIKYEDEAADIYQVPFSLLPIKFLNGR